MEKSMGGLFFVWLFLVMTIGIGWVMNIITLIETIDVPITGILILRAIGIFVVPLGGVLGYL